VLFALLVAASAIQHCPSSLADEAAPYGHGSSASSMASPWMLPSALGGTDINLVTGQETSPRVTQAEGAVWGHQNTVVVTFVDSSGSNLNPISACGVSISNDSGRSFARLPYKFNVGGGCYGEASVLYSTRVQKWFAGFLAGRCGGIGVGIWTSGNAVDWAEGPCAYSSFNVDRPSLWVDNNPGSPFYGRLYAAFNDFDLAGGAPRFVYSADNGATWSAPVAISLGFRRVLKVTGSPGADGTVFVQTLDENGGGLANPRENVIFRSTDGGLSWSTPIAQGPSFTAPGRSGQGYNVGMYSTPVAGYWRHLGSGELAAGPDSVVHYAYTAGATDDPGNIYYVRSTDNGVTWEPAVQLNTDVTTRAQWGASVSVNTRGVVVASWYDERNTSTDALQRFGRVSLDNGATWGADMAISDVIFPKPLQLDPLFQANYVGLHNRAVFSDDGKGSHTYQTWTDGRNSIGGSPQQDLYFDTFAPGPAFVVNTADDHNDGDCDAADCSLREAIAAANALAGEDRIEFSDGLTGEILLGSALPLISSNIDLAGPGANVLSIRRGAVPGNFRVLNFTSSSTFSTVSGLTIANGVGTSTGGGILNEGIVLLANVVVSGNTALNGGGIFNNFGTLTLVACTISGNSVSGPNAGSGGGIFNNGGTLTIRNSTISGNTANGPGGNSDSGGGLITNVGSVRLVNSTIANNAGDIGGGIRIINGGVVRSMSSIIGLNVSAIGPDVHGPIISEGFNLIGNNSITIITPTSGDQIGSPATPLDPMIGPLQANGSSTSSHALLPGSPAIDKGKSIELSIDQRGLARPDDLPYVANAAGGDGSDIGAFEFQSDVIFRDGFEL
jgi:CSLREA domain-containing protein